MSSNDQLRQDQSLPENDALLLGRLQSADETLKFGPPEVCPVPGPAQSSGLTAGPTHPAALQIQTPKSYAPALALAPPLPPPPPRDAAHILLVVLVLVQPLAPAPAPLFQQLSRSACPRPVAK
ncbi:uncharacterized protein K452DRAFT_311862 [Aplosporella prunicola CBS 121167]|uniref:Uncharacterized protein n=1 Tax=Aplosporella prunicola CBS 121167 TaxID=1176127 RepID=A0A6A6B4E7_9PEZI|nr:uncharacterized protein K452DRAFT_311862 [Aplosporella prunicola CBS 121167]KAF2138084.1 hypothetical protein K452DRAFT_311862 [Aplosporella prunicola CBS 121167]